MSRAGSPRSQLESAGIRLDMREQCWRSAERWLTSVSATITLELTVHRVAGAAPPINTDINKHLGINKDGYTNACSLPSQVIGSIAGAKKVYVKHECPPSFHCIPFDPFIVHLSNEHCFLLSIRYINYHLARGGSQSKRPQEKMIWRRSQTGKKPVPISR